MWGLFTTRHCTFVENRCCCGCNTQTHNITSSIININEIKERNQKLLLSKSSFFRLRYSFVLFTMIVQLHPRRFSVPYSYNVFSVSEKKAVDMHYLSSRLREWHEEISICCRKSKLIKFLHIISYDMFLCAHIVRVRNTVHLS